MEKIIQPYQIKVNIALNYWHDKEKLPSNFKNICFEYFSENKNDSDKIDEIFQEFVPFWADLKPGHLAIKDFRTTDRFFKELFTIIDEWEQENCDTIHKGSPYYYYAIVLILAGDIDKGLLLMHQAYVEDKKLNKLNRPAHSFISLNVNNENQLFKQKVDEVAKFFIYHINKYNHTHDGGLNLELIQSKFLRKPSFENEAYYFVYILFKLDKIINQINGKLRNNALASYIELSIIFDLTKISEILLRNIYHSKEVRKYLNNKVSKPKFIHFLEYFCGDNKINLNLKQNHLGRFNGLLEDDFKGVITSLINREYSHNDFVSDPIKIEYDIAITYCLRNYGAHKIEDQNVIYDNFEKIIMSLFNTILFIIEKKLLI